KFMREIVQQYLDSHPTFESGVAIESCRPTPRLTSVATFVQFGVTAIASLAGILALVSFQASWCGAVPFEPFFSQLTTAISLVAVVEVVNVIGFVFLSINVVLKALSARYTYWLVFSSGNSLFVRCKLSWRAQCVTIFDASKLKDKSASDEP